MKILGYIGMFLGIILLSSIAFIYYTEGAEAFSTKTVPLHEEQTITGTEVKNLFVHSDSVDVKVIHGSQKEITVELNGEVSEKMKNAFDLTVTEAKETLLVDLKRKFRPSFTVFAMNKKTELTVTIPEQLYEKVHVETTSGDIRVNDLSGNQVMLKATSGDIMAQNISSSEVSVQASSGDIEVNGIYAQQITVRTSSGDINGRLVAGFSNLALEATSGDITLDANETSFTLDFTATSGEGEVHVPGFLYEEKNEEKILGKKGDGMHSITVKTTSGDFTFHE
ncbi:DUF4097 family beta strand repeat-containing protein [Neobacillus sp. PS2-9]|uniref:DUF4097 family beta strand repeat-containing protein n=1 Tax=Neobacillus sp. PS2-9 TaxID=3070676 RepID=UPI0027DFE37B|nr:DUF4097 family beta strand repeat-containing protein [Neobacillus sp. PS2-9]WML57932.1 DUF4097 family beta strand repeat-containing protein [Neobacillus sp. PS2-9]